MGPIGAQDMVVQQGQQYTQNVGAQNGAAIGAQDSAKGTQTSQKAPLKDTLFSTDLFERAGAQNGAQGAQKAPIGAQTGAPVGQQR